MTDWKIFTITEIKTDSSYIGYEKVCFFLDDDVKYSDGKKGRWITFEDYFNYFKFITWQVGDTVEINLDKTKYYNYLSFFELKEKENINNLMRKVSSSVASTRNAMISASSANPTALAITRDLADRVDKGEQTHFKYEIEDNGVKHSWIYKRN